jgi:plastocyanin
MIILAAKPTEAATYNVTINGSAFSPATLTIAVGDTVVWENTDAFFSHATTSDLSASDLNYWNGWLFDEGDTFSQTFNNAGSFAYHDGLDPSVTGIITVTSSASPEIRLESAHLEGGQFLFVATGLNVGKTNVLEVSTNLTSWVTIQTTVAADTTLTFTNAATLPRRFFRVFELP